MARRFNGGTDKIIAENIASMLLPQNTGTAFTVAGWMYVTATTDFQAGIIIGTSDAYACAFSNSTTAWRGSFKFSNNADITILSGALTINKWTHLAIILSAGVTVNLVVDGVPGTPNTQSATWGRLAANNVASLGGAREAFTALTGGLADVAIWTGITLSASEITALANGAKPFNIRPQYLTGYWPLDGLQSPEPDLSGQNSLQYLTLGLSGSASYASGYTLISRNAPFENSQTFTSVDIYSVTAFSGKLKIMLRNGAGNYSLIQEQTWSHGGTGWETTTLTSAFNVPATGLYYVAIYSATNPANSCGSQSRVYHAGDTGTSTGWTEDTAESFGCRARPVLHANNGTLTGTAFAPGPPVTMFTPRWPNNDFTTSGPSFIPAWAAQSNLPVIGAGTY